MESLEKYGFKTYKYLNPDMSDILLGAEKVCNTLQCSKPFFIGRNGSTEMEVFHFWHVYRPNGHLYPVGMMEKLERVSGIWPATQESVDDWAATYAKSLKELDGLAAGWYKPYADIESKFLKVYSPNSFKIPLRSLEPYYVDSELRWTQYLNGKKVAIVSSFADTIQMQVWTQTASSIWATLDNPETILPNAVHWTPIRTYFPPKISEGGSTSWSVSVKSWKDAVHTTVNEVLSTDAEIVLIGCGALGMCIGAELKRAGRSAILMGGAIQVLFGIKGQRWATHDIISKFWNSAWVYPSKNETPSGAYLIEGGCYWNQSK
jgi:hypothetical protein